MRGVAGTMNYDWEAFSVDRIIALSRFVDVSIESASSWLILRNSSDALDHSSVTLLEKWVRMENSTSKRISWSTDCDCSTCQSHHLHDLWRSAKIGIQGQAHAHQSRRSGVSCFSIRLDISLSFVRRSLQIFDSESHASIHSDQTKEGLSLFGS